MKLRHYAMLYGMVAAVCVVLIGGTVLLTRIYFPDDTCRHAVPIRVQAPVDNQLTQEQMWAIEQQYAPPQRAYTGEDGSWWRPLNGAYADVEPQCDDNEPNAMGVCCYMDGNTPTCKDSNCSDCASTYGAYAWTLTAGANCTKYDCSEGACCTHDANGYINDCFVTDYESCLSASGMFFKGYQSCSICRGACCTMACPTSTCTWVYEASCQGDANSTFHGTGSHCSSSVCENPTGACCYEDLDQCKIVCAENMTEAACTAILGMWHCRQTCAETHCSDPNSWMGVGACCLPGGGCAVMFKFNCYALYGSGAWKGAGSVCPLMGVCPGVTCPAGG